MNIEKMLSDELKTVAASVTPDLPPVADLVKRGERARKSHPAILTTGATLLAAAVTIGVVLNTQGTSPTSTPQPARQSHVILNSLPVGAAPTIPYILDTTLYVDGTVQAGTWLGVQTTGGNTVAVRARSANDYAPPMTGVHFRDGAVVQSWSNVIGELVVSPDGSKVAWIEKVSGNATLIVQDLTNDNELGRLTLDPNVVDADTEGNLVVQSVSDTGTVTYGDVVAWQSWTPGSDPVDAVRPADGAPTPGFPRDAGAPAMSADGAWGAWETTKAGKGIPSETGTSPTYYSVTFQEPGKPETRFTLTLPTRVNGGPVWETATQVLVLSWQKNERAQPRPIRCEIVHQTCEFAGPGSAQ